MNGLQRALLRTELTDEEHIHDVIMKKLLSNGILSLEDAQNVNVLYDLTL